MFYSSKDESVNEPKEDQELFVQNSLRGNSMIYLNNCEMKGTVVSLYLPTELSKSQITDLFVSFCLKTFWMCLEPPASKLD